MPAESLFPAWQARIEIALQEALSAACSAPMLAAAMRHAVLGGGKRLRPLLVNAAGHAFGASTLIVEPAAVAVELVHAFSLVHDDLPAMDDDDLRRGKPTVHVAFDEATAILAGDALQALAFAVLAEAPLDAERRIALVRELASASGLAGMCAGQSLDMAATGSAVELAQLERLHSLKTGALIRAAVRMGAIAAGAPVGAMSSLDAYSSALGLAFQIRDDILDVEGDSHAIGKTAGKDIAQGKATYPALLGLQQSRQRLDELGEAMREALLPLGTGADALRALGEFAIARAS